MSELLPHLARHADDLCVLTAMHTDAQAHETGVPMFHTGHPLQARPSIGSWVLYGLGAETSDLPGFIAMNPLRQFGGNNQGSAFLPASYQATFVRPGGKGGGDPVPNLVTTHLKPEEQRLQFDLLRRINARRLAQDGVNSDLDALIGSYEMAFRMQTAVPELMDLRKESAGHAESLWYRPGRHGQLWPPMPVCAQVRRSGGALHRDRRGRLGPSHGFEE